MGKGDKPRSVDKKKYDKNYEKIFERIAIEAGKAVRMEKEAIRSKL